MAKRTSRNDGQAAIKTLQLCRQVQRALQQELACCPDEIVQSLLVVGVEPSPGPGQLMVTVSPMLPDDERPVVEVLAALGRFTGLLRTAVAHSVSRRKAPQLFFQVSPLPPSPSSSGPPSP
ncbi:MAG: hypothetical protein KDB14_33740 [Planctomycetales bacterium]|nr:hypothetical protein [Planctomycetales bacterium]